MVTITKAVVRRLNTEKDNHFLVYIPLLQKANDKEVNATMEATLVSIRGIDKTIKVGDVVYVSFEDNKLSKPVILGKLYLGELYEKDSGITIVSDSLTVNKSTTLNNTATISGINLDNINNGVKKLIEQNYIDSDNIQYDNAKVLSYNESGESGDIIPLSSSILQDALDDVAIRLSNIENTPSISSIDGLSGGTLTSPLIITGGDSATASKIILNQNNQGQITDSATSTLFGFLNSNTLTVGGNSYALNLRGSSITANNTTNVKGVLNIKNQDNTTIASIDQNGYIVGTRLKSTAATDNSSWSDVWVNNSGWLYKRNKTGFKADLEIPLSSKTVLTGNTITETLSPGVTYECSSNSLISLDITLGAVSGSENDLYMLRFYVGETIPTLTIYHSYSNILWPVVMPDDLQTYTYYELIIKGKIFSLTPTANKYMLLQTVRLLNGLDVYETLADAGTLTLTDKATSQVWSGNWGLPGNIYHVLATPGTLCSLYSLTINGNNFINNTDYTLLENSSIEAVFRGNDTTLTVTNNTASSVILYRASGLSSGITIEANTTSTISVKILDFVQISGSSTSTLTYSGITPTTSSSYSITGRISDLNPTLTFTSNQTS